MLGKRPGVVASVPNLSTDVTDIAGLLSLGERMWN